MAYPFFMSIRALRGATQIESNTEASISSGTAELLEEILRANQLGIDKVISVILTATPDLNATFPAVGARQVGFGSTPLLCSVEIDVPGALERVVRVLLHYESNGAAPHHIYLHGAKTLRRDIAQ